MLRYFVYIFVLLFIFGCGTRKRVMEKSIQKVSSIQNNDIVTEDLTILTKQLYVTRTTGKIIFRPINPDKPFKIGDKEYQNVEIEEHRSVETDSTKTDSVRHTKVIDKSEIKKKREEFNKKVDVERDNSFGFWDWIWLILALVAVFFIVFKRRSIYSFFINLFKKVIV